MKFLFGLIFSLFFMFTTGIKAQFVNVLIGNQHSPEEVSICINPKNHNQIVAGANLDNYYYSSDAGMTWTGKTLVSTGNGVYGDPCVFADTAGNFYFMHLSNPPSGSGSWVDRIVCQRSVDGGITYNNGSYAGLNGSKVQDKHWAAVNQVTNEIYVCWTQFDAYGTHNKADSSIILFSKSSDNAVSWSSPKRISMQAGDCVDSDSTVEGAVPCVGPAGQIYVSWAGAQGLVFNRSLDDGNTWMAHESVVSVIPGGWDYNVSGLFRCNGLPVTGCDVSHGPNRGTIYINWSDQRNGTTDSDIFLARSTDGGTSWSAPMRVNKDLPGRQQFMSGMTIDQANGDLYVLYYDRRAYANGDSTDVYMARSSDGGTSFDEFKINQKAFVPDPNIFFGDYISISAHNKMVRPVWMAYNGTSLSAWTAIIDANMLGIQEEKAGTVSPIVMDQNNPNPFNDNTRIHFDLADKTTVSLFIYDLLGKKVATLYENQKMDKGGHDYIFNAKAAGLSPGIYQYTLESGSNQVTRKMSVN
jgi:hypothetical protein